MPVVPLSGLGLPNLEIGPNLGPNDLQFLQSIYDGGLEKYERRLVSVGLSGLDFVLDAGCGFGQWSLALSATCGQVQGFDIDPQRIRVCCAIKSHLAIGNVEFGNADLKSLPVRSSLFDGVICYSVIFLTQYQPVLLELHRVLKPGGLFYLSANGIGRYVFEVLNPKRLGSDFDSRRYGMRTIFNSFIGRKDGFSIENGAQVMSLARTCATLRKIGFDVIGSGPEGSVGTQPCPFFPPRYLGLPMSFDIIARKRVVGKQ